MMRRKMNDARVERSTYAYKPTGRVLWTKVEGEDVWRMWGIKNWTDEELEKHRPAFEEIGYKDVILVENGVDPNGTKIRDDYGWEILSDKAWDAYESVKAELGADELLQELVRAMDTAEVEKAVADIARDWDEEIEDIDELVELTDSEEVLEELARWMSSYDLADTLAYICRMHELHIPELDEEEEVEVDEE